MQAQFVERLLAEQDWMDRVGQQVQEMVHRVLERVPRSQTVRDILHGTWLGHPLHAALTDVPVGAWTTGFFLDLLSLGGDDERLRRGADASIGFGLVAVLPTALTGLADWSHTSGQTRRLGLLHATANILATLLYTASFLRRLRGRRDGAITLSTAGYLTILGGAFLGGELSYRHGVGVSRNAWTEGPSKFRAVMPEAELHEGEPARVSADGVDAMLVRQDGTIYAIDDTCSHMGCSLAQGKLGNGTITCACHGSVFRISDGGAVHGPTIAPQPRFEVRVRAGMIEIRRPRE